MHKLRFADLVVLRRRRASMASEPGSFVRAADMATRG